MANTLWFFFFQAATFTFKLNLQRVFEPSEVRADQWGVSSALWANLPTYHEESVWTGSGELMVAFSLLLCISDFVTARHTRQVAIGWKVCETAGISLAFLCPGLAIRKDILMQEYHSAIFCFNFNFSNLQTLWMKWWNVTFMNIEANKYPLIDFDI